MAGHGGGGAHIGARAPTAVPMCPPAVPMCPPPMRRNAGIAMHGNAYLWTSPHGLCYYHSMLKGLTGPSLTIGSSPNYNRHRRQGGMMKPRHRLYPVTSLLGLLIVSMLLGACGAGSSAEPTAPPATQAAPAAPPPRKHRPRPLPMIVLTPTVNRMQLPFKSWNPPWARYPIPSKTIPSASWSSFSATPTGQC